MKTWLLGALALSLVLVAGPAQRGAFAQEKKSKDKKKDATPTIKDIMKKVNKGKDALHNSLKTDFKAASPKWDDVTKKTKEYKEFAESLGKNKAPKGDEKEWEKLAKEYADNVKALHEAAEKKNKKDCDAAMTKIGKSCKACHDKFQD